MEATGVPEWDGEICRVCEQALSGDELPGELNLGLAAGGDFGGYSCRVVPADNNTFTVMFT